MRKVAAAALAVPVIVLLVASALLQRSRLARFTLVVGLGVAVGVAALAVTASRPEHASATKPVEVLPLPAGALRTSLRTDQSPTASVQIAFSEPMHVGSVRAALSVEPPAAVTVEWSADGRLVSIAPLGRWASDTYYTITVEPGALARSGMPLVSPVRAVFWTRPATAATIAPTAPAGDRVRVDTAFLVEFDGPVDPSTLAGAFRIDPVVAGSWTAEPEAAGGSRYTFRPLGGLAPDTLYTVALASHVRDADGTPIVAQPLRVRTVSAPSVVRFRPRNGSDGVERGASLSVRFSESMDRAATTAAWSATIDGQALAGSIRWAERDTVLVFDPVGYLPYGRTVILQVSTAARSAQGVPLAEAAAARFTTVPQPPPPKPAPKPAPPPSGSAGTGSWTAVEAYYLKLMNCTRQGGTVTSSGSCSSPGGRNVAALWIDSGISAKVSRPYAKLLATRGLCSHFVNGTPGDRLRRAGYTSYIWAENLGCRSGDPYKAVLGSHLYFQSERSWSPPGGHYVNLMNAKYDRVGIGVWVYAGRVRLVVNFYHPL